MKESGKKKKKLTIKDFNAMWGEDGPYSQVNILEQTRILDSSISRTFLVVKAEINPFTFEYVAGNGDMWKWGHHLSAKCVVL